MAGHEGEKGIGSAADGDADDVNGKVRKLVVKSLMVVECSYRISVYRFCSHLIIICFYNLRMFPAQGKYRWSSHHSYRRVDSMGHGCFGFIIMLHSASGRDGTQ